MQNSGLQNPLRFFSSSTRIFNAITSLIRRRSLPVAVVILSVTAVASWHWTENALAGRLSGPVNQTAVATVSAASFTSVLTPDSIAAAFGANLATRVEVATVQPLPTKLADTTLKVNGQLAPLFFVSPGQINFLIPPGTPSGIATVVVTSGDGTISTGTAQIAPVAPALFTANASGQGALASQLLRVKANGQFIYEPLAQYSQAAAGFVTRPIEFGEESDQLFLILYLTGIRQAASSNVRVSIGGVEYAVSGIAPVAGFTGLDQVNVALPRSFAGRGRITLIVKASGSSASNAAEFEVGSGTTTPGGNAPIQITSLGSSSWLAGEEVEINGTGFAASPRENSVQIVANDGVTTKAEVIAVTGNSMRVRVPYGAGSGQVKVSRGQNEASQAIQVRTSVSGFVEVAVLQSDGNVRRSPIPGARVRISGQPGIERLTDAAGSFVLPDMTPSARTDFEILSPTGGTLNFPTTLISMRVYPGRDNQLTRGAEQTIITGVPLPLSDNDVTNAAASAPDQTPILTFLLPGRTPANLPTGHFSSSIAQLTPFRVPITPGRKITFPNSDAIPAGATAKLFKFDQTPGSATLGQFFEIGSATVSADWQRIETASNAITEGSYYFASIARPTAAINGRVIETDGRPVPRAIVQARGQSTFTDGFGGFVLRDVPVLAPSGDRVKVEVSYQRPNGRVSRKDSAEVLLAAGALVSVKPEIVLDAVTTNFPPIILAPASLTLNTGETRDFDFIIADPDSAGAPQASISGSAAAFTTLSSQGQNAYRLRLSPGANAAGNYTLNLTATDGVAAPIAQTIAVTVNQTGNTPIAQSQSVTTLEDSPRAITLAGSNPGGGGVSYTIVRNPARGSLSGAAPNVLYTPARDFNGVDSFTFKVSSGSAESSAAAVFIAVSPVNDAPVLTVPGTQSVNAGENLNLLVTATDVDGDQALRFTATGLPPGATFAEAGGASRQLNWTPTFTQTGTYTVSVTVTDSGSPALSNTRTVRITADAKWAKTSGPDGGIVEAFFVDGGNIFAGTFGGLYVSTDNTKSWASANSGLTNSDVRAMAKLGDTLFAGTFGGGVFRSIDRGANWTPINAGLGDPYVNAMTVNGTSLYVATFRGVYVLSGNGQNWLSINGGLTNTDSRALVLSANTLFVGTGNGVFAFSNSDQKWTEVSNGLTNRNVQSLAAAGSNLFVGTRSGVFISGNNGQNWTPTNSLLANTVIWGLTANGSRLLASTWAGVFVSTNNGQSWISMNTGLTNTAVNTIAVNGQSLLVGTWGGVFRSNDNAQTWAAANNGLTSALVSSVSIIDGSVFAGASSGAFVSTNSGQSWAAIYSGLTSVDVKSIVKQGTTLFAGTFGNGVFSSNNSGQSWTHASNGLTSGLVYMMLVNGGDLYAATWGGGVCRSSNGGQNWVAVNNGITNLYVEDIALSGNTLVAATDGGIFISTNNGNTWTASNSGLTNTLINVLVVNGNKVFAGTDGGGVFVSSNNGQSWMPTGSITPYVYALAADGTNVFAGGYLSGMYVSSNDGQTWAQIRSGLTNTTVEGLAVKDSKLYAATLGGVFLLGNNGQSWATSGVSLTNKAVNVIVTSGGNQFAGTLGSSVFRSSDQGQSWASVNQGLPPNANIQSIVTNGSTLWAAAFGDGVYRSTDQGENWAAGNAGLSNKSVNELFVNGATVYAGTDDGVFRSTDDGRSWSQIKAGLTNARVISFTASSGAVYAGTDGGVFRLNSDGASWTRASNGLGNLSVPALGANGSALYAGTDGGGIYLSRDGGENWMAVNNQLPPTLNVYAFAVSGRKVYAGSIYGVFLTEDEGRNWKQVNAGLLDVYVTGLAVSGDQLFAGTLRSGVFSSLIP